MSRHGDASLNYLIPSKVCAYCGAMFVPAPLHVFVDKSAKNTRYYCRYSCFIKRRTDDRRRGRAVDCFSRDGQLLGRYKTAVLAGDFNGVNAGDIRRACNGKLKTAGGYVWKWAGGNEE